MAAIGRRRLLQVGAAGVGLAVAGCLGLGEPTRWPMFRAQGNNEAGTRAQPGTALEVGWDLHFADAFDRPVSTMAPSSAVADEDLAYVAVRLGGETGTGTGVLAIDVEDGTVEWRRQLAHPPIDAAIVHPPVVAEEFLFVVAGDRGVVVERETGQSHLEFDLPWVPTTAPGGDRYLIALGGALVAMADLEESEEVRWDRTETEATIHPVNPITVLEDRMFVPVDERVVTLRRGDGEPLSEHPLPGAADRTAPPLVDGFHLHLRVTRPNDTDELIAWRRDDRSIEWREPLDATSGDVVTTNAIRGGQLYVPEDGDLAAVHVASGERDWTQTVDVSPMYPTLGGEVVYLLDGDTLVTLDRNDGSIHDRHTLPGAPPIGPVEPVPRDGALLVTRHDRLLGLKDT